MYGAMLGDIIGSPYEFDRGGKTKDFPLFTWRSKFTDDTVMTVAVAEAFLDARSDADAEWIRRRLVTAMRHWGNRYHRAGYGARFSRWLACKDPEPYNSYGNGAAMRVSAVGWLYGDLDTVRQMARLSAAVTHNHPEGLKGAEATAGAVFLARTGHSKADIKAFAESLGYHLSRTCDQIRPEYHHVESCQETVPEAITAFLEGESFEDVIRTAVSLGGDCDTLTCIAGSIAEAFYGVPDRLKAACRDRLEQDLLQVLDRFEAWKTANILEK